MYRPIFCFALITVCNLVVGPVRAEDPQLENTMWRVPKQTGFLTPSECKKAPTSIVRIKACSKNDGLCGSVLALNPGDDEISNGNVESLVDRNNPKSSLRRRKILGLGVFVRLKPAGKILVGDGYSPCRGQYGKICLRQVSANKMEQWSCLPDVGCASTGPGMLCTPKYTWIRVENVPNGWKK